MASELTLESLRHVTDASQVNAEQLHALFVDLFFNQGLPDMEIPDDDENESGAQVSDDDDDERLTNDLMPRRAADEDDSDAGTIADSDEERRLEAEEARRYGGDTQELNTEFLGWISRDVVFEADQSTPYLTATQTAMRRQIDDHLGSAAAAPSTGRVQMSDLNAEVDGPDQAGWIVHQLCQPGYLLHHTNVAHDWALRTHAASEVHGLIRFMVARQEEPAHVAIYKKDCFPVLMAALYSDPAKQQHVAWSAQTGRHEAARLIRNESNVNIVAPPPLIDAGESWNVHAPMTAIFGRLLFQILEQRERYHNARRARDQVVAVLGHDIPQLSKVFETPFELYSWRQYSVWLKNFTTMSRDEAKEAWELSHSASLECVWRGDQRALSDFAPIPTHDGYSRPVVKNVSPEEWAVNFLRPSSRDLDSEQDAAQPLPKDLVSRCTRAVIEQLSVLPMHRIRVYQAYVATGHVTFTPSVKTVKLGERRVPIRSLLNDSQAVMVELLSQQSSGSGIITLSIPKDALLEALPLDAWVSSCLGGTAADHVREQWRRLLQYIADAATKRVLQTVESQLKTALKRAAEQFIVNHSVNNLAHLCAQGPYEPVELRVGAEPPGALWEARWDDVESVPAIPRAPIQRHAVCGVYRSGMSTCFCIVDAHGVPRISVHWVDAAGSTDEGTRMKKAQEQRLLVALNAYEVAAIAVAVNGPASNRVFSSIQRFLHERTADLNICPDVLWHTCEVVNVVARSEFAIAEYPSADLTQRLAAAVAQTLQDPLLCIARTFDRNKAALELPIGAEACRRAELNTNYLYSWLQYEMSLWVTACGVDINAVIHRSSPETVLQFVAGLDLTSARNLVQTIERTHDGVIKSRRQLEAVIVKEEVARNALSALRVPLSTDLLDMTLIPTALYECAGKTAGFIAAELSRPSFPASLAINQLGVVNVHSVAKVAQSVVIRGFDAVARALEEGSPDVAVWFGSAPDFTPTRFPHLMRLIATELIAQGRSTMRRPFRKVTRERFFEVATGVSYIPDSGALGRTFGFSAVVKGQVVDGVVERINVPKSGDVEKSSIVVKLSFGVRGVINLRDISNELIKVEVRRYATLCAAEPDAKHPVELRNLEPGALVSGVVIAPSYDNCELRLEWSDPRPTDTASMVGGDLGRGTNLSSRSSATGTVNTLQLVKFGAATALLYTTHPKYRDWDHERTLLEMTEMREGDYIVRRAAAGGRYFVVAVKMSPEIRDGKAISVFNIRCHEQRDPSGRLVYAVSNCGRRDVVYDSVEHVVTALVRNTLVRFIEDLRLHDKFRTNPEVAAQQFREELQKTSAQKRVVYAVVEHAQPEREAFYAIVYQSIEVLMQYRPIVINASGYSIKTRRAGTLETFPTMEALIAGFKADFTQRR